MCVPVMGRLVEHRYGGDTITNEYMSRFHDYCCVLSTQLWPDIIIMSSSAAVNVLHVKKISLFHITLWEKNSASLWLSSINL